MLWSIRGFSLLLLTLTLLPQIRSGFWFIRWWDFPRLQLAFLLFGALSVTAFYLFRSEARVELLGWLALLVAAFAWQVSHIIPFSPVWPKEVAVADPDDEAAIKVMVVNLKIENSQFEQVIREVTAEEPDILFFIEIDERWSNNLAEFRKQFPYHHEEIRDEGLGLALWSHVEIEDAETRYLVSDRRCSIWATVLWPNGERVNLVGVHPTPPGLLDSTGQTRRDSRVRDAELVLVAREVAERADEAWVVAGDFNDVAWSHTTRLFKRVSGLLDPRVGRSFLGTYHSQYPPCRCPIDHVFLSAGFSVSELYRKKISGSDHFSVATSLVLDQPEAGADPKPQGDDLQDAREMVDEGQEDAEKRGVDDGGDQ